MACAFILVLMAGGWCNRRDKEAAKAERARIREEKRQIMIEAGELDEGDSISVSSESSYSSDDEDFGEESAAVGEEGDAAVPSDEGDVSTESAAKVR